MRWMLVVMLVLSVACKKKQPPPKNEFEAFERKFISENELLAEAMRRNGEKVADKDIPRSYRAVFIGPSGVFVDSKLVATLAELDSKRAVILDAIADNAMLLPTVGWSPAMTFDLDGEPAAIAISALRLFAGRETHFNMVHLDADVPQRASRMLCTSNIRIQPRVDEQEPQLSVLLDQGRIWVGLSRVNEFQEIPDRADGRDLDKLSTTLREHKASAFFAERGDIEIGAGSGTSAEVIHAFAAACDSGFNDIAVLDRAQLSAVPTL